MPSEEPGFPQVVIALLTISRCDAMHLLHTCLVAAAQTHERHVDACDSPSAVPS